MPQARSGGLVGRVLGGFVIREPLSSGGFGAVFRAEQVALAREAVIKVLHARLLGNETMVQRFLQEARLASRLDHPYAAHIYAFGAEPDGLLWIAMELVRGVPLDRLLRAQGPISLERFVPLLERICEVVHSAHEQGIVHRDLKPANVMVLERAGRLLPKLLDLGIAKLSADADGERLSDTTPMESMDIPLPAATGHPLSDTEVLDEEEAEAFAAAEQRREDVTRRRDTLGPPARATTTPPSLATAGITQVGTTVGSPLYMAPEQWTDAALTGPRTDIYALGILCHEALTGQPPFVAGNHVDLALAHAMAPVPSLGRGFPPGLDAVLKRALEKQPDDRYASALELAGAFRAASGVAPESIGLPRLDVTVRSAAMTRLPRPLALAIDAFDGARNPHQARDACWQLVRTAVRLVAVTALAAHAHVQDPAESRQVTIEEALRRLRERHPSDAVWLAMARELTRPFVSMREAYPVPPLLEVLSAPASAFDELLALRDRSEASGSASQDQALELVEAAIPLIARLIDQLSFLQEHAIAVPIERGIAEEWAGARRDRRRRAVPGDPVAPGRPILIDGAGNVEVLLWPFVQVHEPSPGAPPAVFLFDGKGRRGARLVALPDAFEHEDDALWETFGAFFRQTPDSFGISTPTETCPFPGLASFTGAEASTFFGRERESEAFLNRLRVQPLLTVVGPSGAGKSSFVHAGVLPALPDGWTAVSLRPGPAPMVSLLARLDALGIATGGAGQDPVRLADALRAWASARGACAVLFIDQLEELFTLCADGDERGRFADLLALAARSADDPVRVILTVRDDFLLRLESLPALRARLGPGLQLLTTPLEPDLRRILVEPLRRVGYEFDDAALPDRIIEEVAGTPSALALLSFTAAKLWELRDRRFHHVTARAYDSLGGVGGALAQHAEATLQGMHAEQQRLVREVFRHAVTAEGTRAVLTRAELTEVLGSSAHAGHVIEKLLAARLLVVSDDERGGERIEVTHEALLEAWPRLVGWRREDAEGARLRDQLRAASRQWAERGRPSGLLWRGDALAEFRLWRARYPGSLTASEEAFAAASLAEAARGRRVRRIAFGAAFFALASFAAVLLVQNARVQGGAREMHALLLSQYEDQGRRLLLNDDPVLALAYLHRARRMGAHGPAHDFLLAQAVHDTGGKLHALPHDDMVGRLRFSPDGALIATASMDGSARIWDMRSGAQLARLENRAPSVRVEWSPRGDRLATAADNGVVRLWDRAGRPLQQFNHADGIQTLAFTPDGGRLVTMTVQDEIAVWDPSSGARLAVLRAPGSGPASTARASLAIAPDGVMVAGAARDGSITLWQLPDPTPRASWRAHDSVVNQIAFSPDGSLLASSSETEREAIVWRVATHEVALRLAHEEGLRAAAFSPDGTRILTASDDRTAAIWETASGKRLHTLAGHLGAVWEAIWSPDGSLIATASDDGTAMLWDAASGRRVAHRVGHRGSLRDVAFDARGTRMATASLDGRAIVWTTEPSRQVTPLIGHTGDVQIADFSPTGAHVLTASVDGTARVWDVATGHQLLLLQHTEPAVAAFSPDGRHIATGCDDGVVRLWDARTGARLFESAPIGSPIGEIAWAPDGGWIATTGADGVLRLFSGETAELRRAIEPRRGKIHWVAFHPTRPVLVTTSDDGTSNVWDIATGRQLQRFTAPAHVQLGGVDPTGGRVVSATPNRTAKVWRLGDGAVERELIGHVGNVISASWSRDGAFLVTSGMDGTARIWDSTLGHMLAVLGHGDTWAFATSLSPDMTKLVVGGGGGLAEIWDLPVLEADGAALERIVRCRAPYDTDGDDIVPRMIDPADCTDF
jgi:WD40 repeat protein/serine/threonine protein kinase